MGAIKILPLSCNLCNHDFWWHSKSSSNLKNRKIYLRVFLLASLIFSYLMMIYCSSIQKVQLLNCLHSKFYYNIARWKHLFSICNLFCFSSQLVFMNRYVVCGWLRAALFFSSRCDGVQAQSVGVWQRATDVLFMHIARWWIRVRERRGVLAGCVVLIGAVARGATHPFESHLNSNIPGSFI